MKTKVQAGAHPWIDSYNILLGNSAASSNAVSHAQPVLQRGSGAGACLTSDNYQFAYWDTAAAYQLSLRWQITGDNNYANTAVYILNSWANTCTNLCGDPNIALLSLYGYQFACAAENLRTYTNWATADFTKFQGWMTNVWYPLAHNWLTTHWGACSTHAWANWDLCNMATVEAIGVLADRRDIYNEAISYYTNGVGAGAAAQVMPFSHPGYLGQCQESGRDQGHCTLDPILLAAFCEIAWNQGDDMYGYNTNELLQLSEYVSKFNVLPLNNAVPFVAYFNCEYFNWNTEAYGITRNISYSSWGTIRPGWSMIYNHYANRRGLSAAWTGLMANEVNAEGGGGNYGSNSGGYDQLGFTTLTHTLDPIVPASVPAPSALIAQPRNNMILLSWFGSAGTSSYNVKRSTTLAGTYTNIASVPVPTLSYVDAGLTQGVTYYYKVSAIVNGVETTNSIPASAAPNFQLTGTIIGADGSYNGGGADKSLLFDGSLKSFYDAANATGDWGGLDMGQSNVITQVAYCPRPGFASRMVGGLFQGCNVSNFSSGVVSLATITTTPADTTPPTLTYRSISNPNGFRYVRYIGPSNGSCNAAEVQFFGTPAASVPPVAPLGLQAIAGNRQVALTWSESDTATGYNVKRGTTSGGPYTQVATNIATTTFNDTGVVDFTNYFYVVSAMNANGESANSVEVSAAPSAGARNGSLYWSGATNGLWDSTSLNWATNFLPALYQNGNDVLFDDAGSTVNVSIPSSVSPSSVTFNNFSKGYTLSGSPITGACAVTLLGTAGLALNSANTFSGGTFNTAGAALTLGNSSSLGTGALTMSGGTLVNSANITVANAIGFYGTNTVYARNGSGDWTISGALSGSGTIVDNVAGQNQSLNINGDFSAFTGTFQYTDGDNTYNNVNIGGGTAGSMNASQARFVLSGGANLARALRITGGGASTFQLGDLSGTGGTLGINTGISLVVGALNYNSTFAGTLINGGGLTKVGTGTLLLTGANSYTGANNINAGELVISTTSLTKGNYNVANGATLGVTNTSSSSAIVSNITASAGSSLDFQNLTSTTIPLVVASNMIVSGICTVKVTGTNGLVAGVTYPLISYSGSFSGSFSNMQLQMPYGWRGTLVNSGNRISLANVAVVSTAPPPQVSMNISGSQFQLAWPATNTGWRLQAQTNALTAGIGTNWVDVAGGSATNQVMIPLAMTNGSVFFRLVYP